MSKKATKKEVPMKVTPERVAALRAEAERGTARAQYDLGVLYAEGIGVECDFAETAKWWLRAAEQGEAEAQSYIGDFYATGHGG